MKDIIFTVYDSKSEAYLQPWFVPTAAVAIRAFTDCCKNPEHNFGQHPEDYHLYQVGVWDRLKGTVTAEDAPMHVLHGTHAIKQLGENDK
jgi:hypothetical protein